MKIATKLGILLLIVCLSGSSMAIAAYTLGQETPSNGRLNVPTNPSLYCTDSVDWASTDAPIYNGYTVLQNLPFGTTPTLLTHQFQTGYPTLLQASIQDDYKFSPVIPANTNMGVIFTFIPAAGNAINKTSSFTTK